MQTSYVATLGNTGCKIVCADSQSYYVVKKYVDKLLIIYNWSRKDKSGRPEISRKFGIRRDNDLTILLTRNDGKTVIDKLNSETSLVGEVIDKPINYKVKKCPIKMNGNKTPYDYQEELIQDIIDKKKRGITSTLLSLQTGKGKSFISINVASRIGGRLILITKAEHIPQWRSVLIGETELEDENILTVAGTAKIRKVLKGLDDKHKAILISTSTLHVFYKNYENNIEFTGEDTELSPYNLFKQLNGTVLIDELDEIPVAHYKTMSYELPIPILVTMSASFFDSQAQLNNIYFNMFPKEVRIEIKLDKYVQYTTLLYRFSLREPPVTSYRNTDTYSNIAYEQWIAKRSVALKEYLAIIKESICVDYLKNRDEKKHSLLIFVAGLEMADIIHRNIFGVEPFSALNSVVYTGEDGTLEEVLEADVVVTTITKSKAGLDKPGLITVIDTTNEASFRSAVQKPGRLRKIEGKNFYISLVNSAISSHQQYAQNIYKVLRTRVKSIKAFNIEVPSIERLESLYHDYAPKFKM